MNLDNAKKWIGKPMMVGVAMLIVGVLIGLGAERFAGRSTTPKGNDQGSNVPRVSKSTPTPRLSPDPFDRDAFDAWDPFREMRELQAEMNQMFRRSVERFHASPLMDPFKDPDGYSSSLDVRELNDRIEVRAFVPDTKAANANVKLTGNRLEVAISHGQKDDPKNNNSSSAVSEWGQYTQVVELPGNLKGDQMKVERKDHELLITIPKA